MFSEATASAPVSESTSGEQITKSREGSVPSEGQPEVNGSESTTSGTNNQSSDSGNEKYTSVHMRTYNTSEPYPRVQIGQEHFLQDVEASITASPTPIKPCLLWPNY